MRRFQTGRELGRVQPVERVANHVLRYAQKLVQPSVKAFDGQVEFFEDAQALEGVRNDARSVLREVPPSLDKRERKLRGLHIELYLGRSAEPGLDRTNRLFR